MKDNGPATGSEGSGAESMKIIDRAVKERKQEERTTGVKTEHWIFHT